MSLRQCIERVLLGLCAEDCYDSSFLVGEMGLRWRRSSWLRASQLPETINIAYFDTTFHTKAYPLFHIHPFAPEIAQKMTIGKY